MHLKKVFAILLALLVVLSFAACDGGGGGNSSGDDNGGGSGGGNGGGGETTVPAPLCFEASEGEVEVCLLLTINGEPDTVVRPSLEWSSDGKKWNPITINTTEFDDTAMPVAGIQRAPVVKDKTATTYITKLVPGFKMYIRAADTNDSFYKADKSGISFIRFYVKPLGGTVEASGNIMSLLDATRAMTAIPSEYCFYRLFYECYVLTKAPELPATTLTANCYEGMFGRCYNLKEAPVLPATTLAEGCYYGMFNGCGALTTAPKLPATTLAENCYGWMFYACHSLTKAPELPATELVPGCYYEMFACCEELKHIKVSFTDWGNAEDKCTHEWVWEVSADGNFECPKPLYDVTNAPDCDTIPKGWTVNGKTAKWMME